MAKIRKLRFKGGRKKKHNKKKYYRKKKNAIKRLINTIKNSY